VIYCAQRLPNKKLEAQQLFLSVLQKVRACGPEIAILGHAMTQKNSNRQGHDKFGSGYDPKHFQLITSATGWLVLRIGSNPLV